jgi:hypothetical protein
MDQELKQNREAILRAHGNPHADRENKRFAWQIELEDYRRRKRWERFYKVGAFCGILSLLLQLYFHGGKLIEGFGGL